MKEFSNPIAKEVWQMIRASRKEIAEYRKKQAAQEEVRRKKQAAQEAKARKEIEEIRALHKEISEQMKANNEEISEQMKANNEEIKKRMKETDKQYKKMIGNTGNYWGRLGENLTKGNLAKRLKERGIKVEKVLTRLKRADLEYDILAVNGKEAVIVEVKASLDSLDVRHFKSNIDQFKKIWPEFKDKILYGAISYSIKADKEAVNMAKEEGFFVIAATGDVIVENAKNFKPKIFH